MSPRSASKSDELPRHYSAALREYLSRTPGTTLRTAETLGRQAVAAGVSTSALATLHKHALMTLVSSGGTVQSNNGRIARASTFFVAALKPMDKNHGAMAATSDRLTRLTDKMRRSTRELAGTRRELQRESARRKKLETSLKESKRQHAQLLKRSLREQESLRRLSHGVLSAQEQERKRISRELHDEIGQILTAVNVKLATLTAQVDTDAKVFKQTIRSTQRLVVRSMAKVHRFARDLRPPLLDDLGLIPALKAQLDTFTERVGIPVRFKVFSAVEKLGAERRTVVYRVVQEAVANVAAHARASHVNVEIRRDGGVVRVHVHDNGRGFDVKRRLKSRRITRLGLLGMRERVEMVGGSFEIESIRGEGTTIRAELPLDGRRKSPRARREGLLS